MIINKWIVDKHFAATVPLTGSAKKGLLQAKSPYFFNQTYEYLIRPLFY